MFSSAKSLTIASRAMYSASFCATSSQSLSSVSVGLFTAFLLPKLSGEPSGSPELLTYLLRLPLRRRQDFALYRCFPDVCGGLADRLLIRFFTICGKFVGLNRSCRRHQQVHEPVEAGFFLVLVRQFLWRLTKDFAPCLITAPRELSG